MIIDEAGMVWVALRKESVDRNPCTPPPSGSTFVALRKESVDRNSSWVISSSRPRRSLSARRAWIEIWMAMTTQRGYEVALRKESVDRNGSSRRIAISFAAVALRKESVDRNRASTQSWPTTPKSLSARRAWIEMMEHKHGGDDPWSLSARRAWIEIAIAGHSITVGVGRSPQGERG